MSGKLPEGWSSTLRHLEVRLRFCQATKFSFDASFIQYLNQTETIIMQVTDITGHLPSHWDGLNLRHLHLLPIDGTRLSLSGLIPFEMCNSKTLESLKLQSTSIVGFSEKCSSAHAPKLFEFDVRGSTEFYATFYMLFLLNHGLTHIDCSSTRFYGQSEVASMMPLVSLRLADTKVDGNLVSLGTTPTLVVLDLWNTPTTGMLNELFTHDEGQDFAAGLQYLDLGKTKVFGTIPDAIRKLKKLRYLDLSFLRLTNLPDSIGELVSLEEFSMKRSPLVDARIPANIGNLQNLRHLSLSQCNLTGQMPPSMSRLRRLEVLDLSGNFLEGPIPDELYAKNLDLSSNALVGTVSPFILASTWNLDLHQNLLGPTLASELLPADYPFQQGSFDLSRNAFSGPLPILSTNASLSMAYLDLSHNNFTGTLPLSMRSVTRLDLSSNELSGELQDLFTEPSMNEYISLAHNKFTGPMPALYKLQGLSAIDLSFNLLYLPFSPLPPSLREFQIANNPINAAVDEEFIASVVLSPSLRLLNLAQSRVEMTLTTFYPLLYSNLTHLSLKESFLAFAIPDLTPILACTAMNTFLSSLPLNSVFYRSEGVFSVNDDIFRRSPLEVLDLSYSRIGPSTFPHTTVRSFPALQILDLSRNYFYDTFPAIRLMPAVIQINISTNQFEFDPSQEIRDMVSLVSLDVSYNRLYGSLALSNLPLLQTADFRHNKFDRAPYYPSFQSHFSQYALQTLNIAENWLMPRYTGELKDIGLNKTSFSSPMTGAQAPTDFGDDGDDGDSHEGLDTGGICYALSFDIQHPEQTFRYDENLFSYAQCECDDKHFGLPAKACVACPLEGAEICRASNITGLPHYFLFPIITTTNTTGNGTQLNISTSGSIQGENCRYSLRQQLAQKSNCIGASLSATSFFAPNVSVENLLHGQCANGSKGHLCSHCICTHENCWFDGGAFCKKCAFVFSSKQAVPAFVSIVIVLFAAITGVFWLVLRSKRTFNNVQWEKLNLPKRIFYRLLLLTSLGNVAIVVAFLQLLAEIFHWDEYAISGVLSVLNGSMEGIGLPCVLPFLRDQFNRFMIRIMLPYILIALIVACAMTAELLYDPCKLLRRCKRQRDDSSHEEDPLLEPDAVDQRVSYPIGALITSVSLTIIRFFYFGTAIAAFENLFYLEQPYTRIRYSKNTPWMLFSDVKPFIYASIPTLLMLALVFPAGFVYLCIRLRRSFQQEDIKIYFGTLFDNFSPRFFWWEMVNILRKLAMALIIRGLSSSSALQHMLIGLILGITQMAALKLNPWRRSGENLADAVSQLLLLLSLFLSRNAGLSEGSISVSLIMTLDVGFLLASIGYIGFLAITQPTAHHLRLASQDKAELDTLQLNGGKATDDILMSDDSDMGFH